MTRVKQSKLYAPDGIHNGDCLAACLASLLDLPLWMVPPFEQMFGRSDWRVRVGEWLRRFFDMDLERAEGHPTNPDGELAILPEFYIANGPAARGVYHSVIYRNGELVHDPHPSNGGLLAVEWCWYLANK